MPIKVVDSHRDLGVVVDSVLKFHDHIRQAANKAGGVMNNLLKSTVCRSPDFMKKLFVSDVRPIIDFASQVWNLGYIEDMKMLESIQRRWTKKIDGMENYSYGERLKLLDLFSIKGRLLRSDLILCWKIFHGESVIQPNDMFTLAPLTGTRGHCYKVQIQHSEIEARRRFFCNRVAHHWNSLPQWLVSSGSIEAFKGGLASHCQSLLVDYHD